MFGRLWFSYGWTGYHKLDSGEKHRQETEKMCDETDEWHYPGHWVDEIITFHPGDSSVKIHIKE